MACGKYFHTNKSVESMKQRRSVNMTVLCSCLVCLQLFADWSRHHVEGKQSASWYSSSSPLVFLARNNNATPASYDNSDDWDDPPVLDKEDSQMPWLVHGSGFEFSVFDSMHRGGDSSWGSGYNADDDEDNMKEDKTSFSNQDNAAEDEQDFFTRMEQYHRERRQQQQPPEPRRPSQTTAANSPLFSSRTSSYPSSSAASFHRKWRQQQQQQYRRQPKQQQQRALPIAFQRVQKWWTTNVSPKLQSMPKIVCRVEPTTTLKLRKTFRPLKMIIRFGADFNTQLGVWQFKSSWEDAIIGGKLTLAGKELQLTKSWQLSVGAMEDLVTRLRFRAAINLQTFQAYARVGFRTERLTPINVIEGFTISKRVPLDGTRGNVKLEVKANVALPEPEIEYSTETQRSLIGMGDIEVSIEELNLLLDY